jgi:hypothetical protein
MSSIQPTNKTITQTIVRFSLDISQLILNQSATFRVSLYDKDDTLIDTPYITLQGTDYLNWGSSDDYVIRFVANQLGFVLI